MDRVEFYNETMRWQSAIMMVYDIDDKLEKQRRELAKTEKELQLKKSELPENILKEYEEMRCFDKLKQP